MQRTYAISDGRLVETADGTGPIQVFIAPDEAERRLLVESYKLDEHTLNSALDPDELARLEFEPEHAALIFKRPRNYSGKDGVLFKVSSCGVYLFKDRLLLVQADDVALFEGRQFTRVSTLPEVMLKLIYGSVFHFLEHLKIINTISGELEQKINQSIENRHLLNLFGLEKSLVYYLSSINTNAMLLDKLKLNATRLGLSHDEAEFLDDTIIENTQCYKQAEIYSNILASLMDARASLVGNNLNLLMKTLNVITIGIMVPTLVVSAFSMNVTIPLQRHPQAFWIILAIAVSSVGIVLYARRRFW